MKSLKFSFAAIIAILAIGVTFAAQAGLFEAKKVVADCYQPTAADGIEVRTICNNPESPFFPAADCISAVVGDHIYDLSSTLVDPDLACPGGSKFCCLRVVQDLAPCTGQPKFGTAPNQIALKVAAVFCKLN